MKKIYCFHGFLGSSKDWTPFFSSFAPFELQIVELPCKQGWSESIREICGRLEPDSILCGYSMGARIALGCAIQSSQLSKALIFISGNPGLENESQRDLRWHHDRQVAEKLKVDPIDEFLEDWYCQEVFDGLTKRQIEQLIRRRRDIDREYQSQLLTTYSISKQPDFWPALKNLHIPILLLSGERDAKYCEIAKRMCTELRNCEHLVIPDCGHIVPFEQPDRFAKGVFRFLKRLG